MSSVPRTRKVVILGSGFLGTHITRALAQNPSNRIQLTSRNPRRVYDRLIDEQNSGHKLRKFTPVVGESSLLPPISADATDKTSLVEACRDASVVVSLVAILNGSRSQFEEIQWRGVCNIVDAVQTVNAESAPENQIKKIIHVSALGADPQSSLHYFRTKALAEQELLKAFGKNGPSTTIFRPGLIFGEGDGFFQRFSTIAGFFPFLPVFGGGKSLFQPVFAGDIGKAMEILARTDDADLLESTRNTVIQAGGPEVLNYRQMMERILKHTNRYRPIVSLPFAIGKVQGMVLEKLPENILTVTRSQIEQLKMDNVVIDPARITWLSEAKHMTLTEFLSSRTNKAVEKPPLHTLDEVLPTYL